jgi:hypothetical protein
MAKFKVLAAAALLLAPLQVWGFATSQLTIPERVALGQPVEFSVTFDSMVPNGYMFEIVLANAPASVLGDTGYLDANGWQTLPIDQVGPDVIGVFPASSGSTINGMKQYLFRTTFNLPGDYVMAFVLKNESGAPVSSSAKPVNAGNGNVLGMSVVTAGMFNADLAYGSAGQDVVNLQNKLTALGFYSGPVTGFYGVLTTAAVRTYQIAHGLPVVGSLGPQTRAVINAE